MKRFLKITAAVMAVAVVVVATFQIVTFLRKDKNTDVQAETVAPIIAEDVEDRNENSKTFIRKDGSYTKVISLEPIHYYDDENGSWLDITYIRTAR